jgi:hypothetical protein
MNTLISFEIAKLLKEKGYPFEFITVGELKEVPLNIPTIVEVVMWLYEKHGIWINGGLYSHLGNVSKFQFTIESQKSRSTNSMVQLNINPFNSPTEAYEAAIEYTLKNLL